MIIVTGGAGFIGSNLIKGLNEAGEKNILVVDDLEQKDKFKNLVALDFSDYLDKDEFLNQILDGLWEEELIEAVFHQGACSDTMEHNGKYMMDINYEYSKTLLHFCMRRNIPFIYASSASVYGNGNKGFREDPICEAPLNVYGFSKWHFDRYVETLLPQATSQIVGLRYFNVYGPQENHKGRMASVSYHLFNQLNKDGTMRLFCGIDGYGDGEQRRDFIYVKDVVKVNLFFLNNPDKRGIFNCGTGQSQTFNELAHAAAKSMGFGKLVYIEFPEALKGKYQNFTEADKTKLRSIGYDEPFMTLDAAVSDYYHYLRQSGGYFTRENSK